MRANLIFLLSMASTAGGFYANAQDQIVPARCASYLRKASDGYSSVGVYRIESLRGVNTSLLDVSGYVRERRLPSDKRINIFRLSDVFAEEVPFLGFGHPNVFLGLPPKVTGEEEWQKFAAKSLKRADSTLENTRGLAQSGVLIVFPDLAPERSEKLYESAKKFVGTRHATCVNANCNVMADAGFTIGGETLRDYYFPAPLLRDLLRYGLEFEGEKVEFDVVRVNAEYLEEVGLRIDRAVGTTFCRHLERDCDAQRIANENTFVVFAKKAGKRFLSLFLGTPDSERKRVILEESLTRLAPTIDSTSAYDIRVTEPSHFGTWLRLLWGPHSLFEMNVDPGLIDPLLPGLLAPFPNPNPSLMTRIKKLVLFSETMVSFLRSQLAASYRLFDGLNSAQLFDMFRTDSEGIPNKYNLVVLGDRIIVMKIGIKMKLVDWILSKHLILSGYLNDVRFAGEIYKTADGVIHINRNSGTYQPTSTQLQAAAELIRSLFPGLEVVIDDDPTL